MPYDSQFPYWMNGDDGGFDDSGGGDDGSNDDGAYDDGANDDDSQGDDQDPDDDGQNDGDDGQNGGGNDADGAGGDGGGDDGNDDVNDEFSDPDDLLPLDDDVALSADNFPNAESADFQDDDGGWSQGDYQKSAENLFGDHQFFGDTMTTQRTAEGYQPFGDERFLQGFDEVAPGSSETVELFEREGHLSAFGFVSIAMLEYLRMKYTGIDLSNLDVSLPDRGEPVAPQPLPPAFDSVQPLDGVDLRKHCTPIGDQQQTSRCSAFAWTHATELVNNLKGGESPRLSPTFTMLEFQRMQGDAKDYSYAYSGGNGTVSGTDPGRVLAEQGTCRQELWPDPSPSPAQPEPVLISDSEKHRLDATPHPIALDDVRKVLSAGCPVHVAINTGPVFSEVGRDGVFNAAEPPNGFHGRHAMLIVGYIGNFYIVKNSWGENWGDQGYCYIPKQVLADSDPDLIAVLVKKPE